MPENETLIYDARSATRWRPVAERMDGGQSPVELFPEIQDQFYTALQKVWKQWKERGVDPDELFQAALTNPEALRDFIKRMSFDLNARLLRDVAAGIEDSNMEVLIREFLQAAWDVVDGQLLLGIRDEDQSLEFNAQISRMLNRITKRLVDNPSRFPNRPSRNESPPDLDTQLGQSLL